MQTAPGQEGPSRGGVGRSIVDKGAGTVTGEVREVTGVTAGTGPHGAFSAPARALQASAGGDEGAGRGAGTVSGGTAFS